MPNQPAICRPGTAAEIGRALGNSGDPASPPDNDGSRADMGALDGVEVSVDPEPDGLPTSYALNPAFPNPFNPTTSLRFALPVGGNLSIVLYDAQGRFVQRLVSGQYKAGFYHVTLNAANLPAGLYLVRMEAGAFSTVQKVVLVK